MALPVILVNNTTTWVGANNPELDLSNTNDVLVTSTGMVMSTTGIGISSTGSSGVAQHADIEGTVIGATIAIDMGSAAQHDQTLYVGQNAYIANLGGTEAAVVMRGYDDVVTNHGVIHGVSAGLEMQALGAGNHSTVDNFNLIEGGIAMRRDSGFNQEIILHNHGEMRGTTSSIIGYISYNGDFATTAVDTIENSGLMFGSVLLGGGNDSYDGTGGRVESGVVSGDDGADTLTGGDFVDLFQGGAGADELHGAGGDDALNGNSGADIVDGGAGNDSLFGGTEGDTMTGGDGDDQVHGEAGADIMDGGAGNDTMDGGSEADTMHGGAGNDTVDGGSGADTLDGDAGNDVLTGGSEADTLRGGDGNDQLDGGTGADSMDGGAGDDTFTVDDAGDKVFDFGGGVDLVRSSVTFNFADPNQAQGSLDNLELTGADNINGFGNNFANVITGNAGNNRIDGKGGNDTLSGLAGKDRIDGGLGNDKLNGGLGDDRLDGGLGKDTMTGGLGKDQFVFDTKLNASTNVDVVTDFRHGTDKILLDNAIFKALGLVPGNLKAGFFYSGSAAHDADDHIIYNKASGALSYDADGAGGHAAVQFATLSSHPVINFHDFAVV